MAHSTQAQKRIRQNETHRLRNKARMSAMKTRIKAVMAAIRDGDRQKAAELVGAACKSIDKAAKTRVIHPHRAARHKGQLMRAVAGLQP